MHCFCPVVLLLSLFILLNTLNWIWKRSEKHVTYVCPYAKDVVGVYVGVPCPVLSLMNSNLTNMTGVYEDNHVIQCDLGYVQHGGDNREFITMCDQDGEWTVIENCVSKYSETWYVNVVIIINEYTTSKHYMQSLFSKVCVWLNSSI